MTNFAEDERVYATETLGYLEITDAALNDGVVETGDEGTVVELTGDDAYDLYVEWDRGFCGSVSSGDVAPVGAVSEPVTA